ncbi:MAG: TonB-dependent receptor [Bacteroides sp.]|nr:TonB-dependent receptor [Bacteroides sp.]
MKKDVLFFIKKRTLLSSMIAFAFLVGSPQFTFSNVYESHKVMQNNAIKGRIVDNNNEPIIGASVKVKGTNNGVITDIDGNFSVNTSFKSILVISYIGYKTQEVPVSGRNSLKITMIEDSELLDEVVVVGYGTQKKATMTGSVTVVDDKIMENKGTLSSPVQALQGQVPGVIITRSSAAPGDESWSMSLRGAVSKNSTSPLIIIDGVEYESVNELRLLNPSDIESINFLKDASASIYGSKAAGGVILVQTKKAKEGKTRVEYSGSISAKFVGLSPTQMNLDQWANAVIQARTNDGYTDSETWMKFAKLALANKGHYIDLDHSQNPIPTNFNDVADFVFFDTDWNNIMWGTASSNQHELSVSGGTDKSLYRLSLGYMYDGSNLRWGNNNNQRYNFRLSNTFKLTDAFSIESVVAYNRQDQVAPTQIGSALSTATQQPGFPSATANGKPYAWGTWGAPNWYCELGGDNKLKVSAINISETFKYALTKELNAVVTAGYNTSTAIRDKQSNAIDWYNYAGNRVVRTLPKQEESSYTKSSARTDFYSISGYMDWHHTFAEDHDLKVMIGSQYNLKEYDYASTLAKNILSSLETINGSGQISIDKAEKWHEAVMSYYGRLNYAYKSKYLFEGLARYDGSSKFRPKNRWAAFWGVSGGWRITEEAFMKNIKFINDLKLRLSYGNVGNQSGIDRYDGIQLYNFKSNSGALIGNNKASYIETNGKLISMDRTWERIHNYNIGLDFGLIDSHLTGTVELFMKKCNNMLIDITYPGVLGDAAPTTNKGKFKANGWEGNINWTDKIDKVSYHIGGTFTYATNELVDNGGDASKTNGVVSNREGYPLNSVFGLRYCGKIQTQEQLDKYKERDTANSTIGSISSLRLGDNMFEDVNHDGKLTEEDYVYLGTDDPKIQFSFNGGLEFEGIDFSFVLQGVGKRTILREGTWRVPMYAAYQNSTNQSVNNIWSSETPNAYYPSYTNNSSINNYNYQSSSWSVEDGSYLRLKNITLGYTLPTNWLAKTRVLSKIHVYVSGQDLWEHSNIHDGWDPEATRKVSTTSRYPFTRTLTFGADITF